MKKFYIKYLALAIVLFVATSLVILPKQNRNINTISLNSQQNDILPSNQIQNQNSGLSDNKAEWYYKESSRAVTGALSFSQPSGFYQSPFNLSITCDDSSYKIKYTTSSNLPTVSSTDYTGPISITNKSNVDPRSDHITVIRAAAFNGNSIVNNKVYTMVYIINSNTFQSRYSMPVVSLVTDQSNLYGSKGIIDNPINSGREWERPVNVTFFETDSSVKFSIDAGIRMFGGTSRNNEFIKSFKLLARKEYDPENGMFKHEIFPGLKDRFGNVIKKYNGFLLHNAGNDSIVNDNRASHTRDGLLHRIAGTTGLDFMDYRPAIVYLNGSYYGTLNLREFEDENYIESHYNIPSDQATMVGNGNYLQGEMNTILLDNGPSDGVQNYWAMVNYIIGNNMSDEAKYQKACQLLDMDSFIKYMAFEMYICNLDWPQNNLRAWRYSGPVNDSIGQDGKWRYMLKDLDFGLGRYNESNYSANTVTTIIKGDNDNFKLKRMVKSLLANPEFKNKFSAYLCDLVNDVMDLNKVSIEIDRAKSEYNLEIDNMLKKYSPNTNRTMWTQTFTTMKTFVKNRGALYLQWAGSALKLSGTAMLTVNRSPYGAININTVSILTGSDTWSGKYFKGTPFNISAVPISGYEFTGFTITGGKIEDNKLILDSNATLTANFKEAAGSPSTGEPVYTTDPEGNPIDSEGNPVVIDPSADTQIPGTGSSQENNTDKGNFLFIIIIIGAVVAVLSAGTVLFIIFRKKFKK